MLVALRAVMVKFAVVVIMMVSVSVNGAGGGSVTERFGCFLDDGSGGEGDVVVGDNND